MYPTKLPNFDYLGIRYPEYFKTEWWITLKDKLIYTNPKAKCWICEKKYNLLIHHENYQRLFHEKLNRDVFILCFQCHEQLHFYRILWVFKMKTPLQYKKLKRRRLFLRFKYCIQNKYFISSIWHFFRYLFCL